MYTMRGCLLDLLQSHGGTPVPRAVVEPFTQRGTTALTMRYGPEAIHEHGDKAITRYVLTAVRFRIDCGTPCYYGHIETPDACSDIGFLFHTEATEFNTQAELDAAVTAFALDLVEETNTETEKWFVTPGIPRVREAFTDYPHDLHPAAQPHELTLHAPATGDDFTRPSNLCRGDLRFIAALRATDSGSPLLETDAPPTDVKDGAWVDRARTAIGADGSITVRERGDGGTQLVLTET